MTPMDMLSCIKPEAVMVELVVASKSRESTHANTVGEKDLSRAVDPSLSVHQLGPVDVDVVPESFKGS